MRNLTISALVACLCIVGCGGQPGGGGGGGDGGGQGVGAIDVPAGDVGRPAPGSVEGFSAFLSSDRTVLIRGDDKEGRATITAQASADATFEWTLDAPEGLLELLELESDDARSSTVEITLVGDPGAAGRTVSLTIAATLLDGEGTESQTVTIRLVRPDAPLSSTLSLPLARIEPGEDIDLSARISGGDSFAIDLAAEECTGTDEARPPNTNPPYTITWSVNADVALQPGVVDESDFSVACLGSDDDVIISTASYRAPIGLGTVQFTVEARDAAGNRTSSTSTLTIAPDAELTIAEASSSTAAAIPPGKSTDINTTITGGTPPYTVTFAKRANTGGRIVGADLAEVAGCGPEGAVGLTLPVNQNRVDMTYRAAVARENELITVTACDVTGNVATASVPLTIESPQTLVMTAAPQFPRLNPSGTTPINVAISGGTPPYTACFDVVVVEGDAARGTLEAEDNDCEAIDLLTNCVCDLGDPAQSGLELVELAKNFTAPDSASVETIEVRVRDAINATVTDIVSLEVSGDAVGGAGGGGGTGAISITNFTATPNTTPCFGNTWTVTVNTSGGSGGNVYTFTLQGAPLPGESLQSNGVATTANSVTYFAPAGTPVTRSIDVMVSEQGGTSDSSTTTLTVFDDPNCAITAGPVCPNTINNEASVVDAGPGATYAWTILDGTFVGATNDRVVHFDVANPGSGTVTLGVTITTAEGCDCTSQKLVAVDSNPTTPITTAPSVCLNSTLNTASVPPVGQANFAWTVTCGTITTVDPTTASQIEYTADTAGPCTVDVTITPLSGGCQIIGTTANANVVDPATDCDDTVGCTDNTCVAGVCTYVPNDALCDNGLWCDGAETCNATLDCQAGTAPDCNDGVGCTDDSCNEGTDSCDNVVNDANCDNGLWCDGAETCDATLDCQAGTAPDCNDSVGCTDDSCNEGTDSCDNVVNDANCDDGLWCNGAETCDATLDCQAGTAPDCNDAVGCTDDSCNEGTDSCDNVVNDANCDNGLWCDGAETCDATLDCQAGTAPDCNDAVACTDDSCNEGTDSCDNVPNDGLCDNGLFCDGVESCDAVAGCQDEADPCPGGTVCDEIADACVGCLGDGDCIAPTPWCRLADNTCVECIFDADCNDGLFCNGIETCDGNNVCQPGLDPCDDSVACTDDACDEGTDTCSNTVNDANCDNGVFCDGAEFCHITLGCQIGPDPCDDSVPCTDDACDEGTDSCGNTVNDANCDDGLFCNGAETCHPTLNCQAGTAPDCNDGVGCTDDSCNEGTDSCDNIANDANCDNGLWCDGAETCDATLDCQAGTAPDCDDSVGCTDDSCNEGTDSCDNIANDANCDNGLWCDGAETCDATLDCQAGTAPDCDDSVGCTDDSCNEGTDSCDNIVNDANCDNGLWCDGAEPCDATLDCQAGTAPDCDDSIGCTDDSCNEGTDSCDNVPNDGLCDNGLFCDGAETCDAILDCQVGTDPCPGEMCREGDDMCVECLDNADCGGLTPLCRPADGLCVECLGDGDCTAPDTCQPDGTCA